MIPTALSKTPRDVWFVAKVTIPQLAQVRLLKFTDFVMVCQYYSIYQYCFPCGAMRKRRSRRFVFPVTEEPLSPTRAFLSPAARPPAVPPTRPG